MHFEDARPSEPIEFLYDTLDFELKNLSTLPDDSADMTLVAIGPDGGQIDWTGNFSLIPIASEGKLKITDGKMKAFWPYVRDAVPLVLENGVISLSTDYKLNLAKETELLLNNVAVSIAPFAIKAPDGRPLAKLERLDVSETTRGPGQAASGGRQDPQPQTGNLGRAGSRRPTRLAEAVRQPTVQTGCQSQGDAEPASTPAAADSPKPEPAAPSKPWQVLLKDVQLRDYTGASGRPQGATRRSAGTRAR